MSQFDRSILDHLKKLSRIDCDREEEEDILLSLKRVLDYIEQLNEVDTEGVAPCSFVLRSTFKNYLRNDEIEEVMPRDEFLGNAPDKIAGMIRIPPVLKAP